MITAAQEIHSSRAKGPEYSLEAIIVTEGLSKVYRMGSMQVHALRNASLDIARGEFVALMGASGSGKSTLLHLLGCLERPSAGRYYLEGRDVSALSRDARAAVRSRRIGFVFQNFNLLPRTTALENVMMPLSYTVDPISDREAKRRATELLQRVGLADRLDHFPSQLSGGQQQRVAIARSLVNQPRLLFADEPTGNLDSKTSAEVLEMFQKLNDEEGITIILVTHDPGVAEHAKRVIRMRDGRIEDADVKLQAVHAAAEAIAAAGSAITSSAVTSSAVTGSAVAGGVR